MFCHHMASLRRGKQKAKALINRTSSLPFREHKKYLFLLQRYANKVISVDTPEEEKKAIKALMCLHKKVVAEQKEFIERQKANAKSSIDYNFIHPEASRYVKELVQKKLQSCFPYPRHYAAKEKFNVLEKVKIDSSILPNLVCNLLELGNVPRLILSSLENCTIPCNFTKMCRRFPVSLQTTEQHPSKQPISQDSIAKTLADKHLVDMVLTFSSLKHLLICGSLDSGTSWELPVIVESFQSDEAMGCSTKRVFIDKAIPVGSWFAPRKNALYYKYGAKLQFTHFKPSRSSRISLPFNQGNSEEKHQSRELVDLQDSFFEAENFDHETFGRINCPGDKVLPNELSIENEVFDSKSMIANGSTETKDDKNKDINSSENIGPDKNSSDHPDKECKPAVKEEDIKVEGSIDVSVENSDFNEVSGPAAANPSDKDALCNYLQLMNKDAVIKSESKDSSLNVNEQKTSNSSSEESPKCKKRKTKNEPPPVLPGRRVTRSQTKKLEGAVKHPRQFKKLTAEMEMAKQKQDADSGSEVAAESTSQQKKGSDKQCDKNTQVTEGVKSVEKDEVSDVKENVREETSLHSSEHSSDSSLRLSSKKLRLLSSDDDSDDNLVIDETITNIDSKPKDLDKAADIVETSTGGTDDANLVNDNTVVNEANLEINAQNVSSKHSTVQSEQVQPPTIAKMSPENKKNSSSTLDQILHLQEQMLKPKQKSCKTELPSPTEQKGQESLGPQPGLPTYLEDSSQFQSLNPSLSTNVQYSLWNMGQLKVIMRSKLDSRQLNNVPCFIFSKLEYQSEFGAEICTTQELLDQWITLVCHPGSTGLRVRIDAQTAKVLMTEELTLPNIHSLVAKLSPEMPLCWVIHVLEKLKELPNGQYLLSYQKKDDFVTLYTATDRNKRGDYDLHTAIRQRLVAFDYDTDWKEGGSETEIPWLPLDPDVLLPTLVSRGRIPATFPPANEKKAVPETKKKTSKKKARKKMSNFSKMKATSQKI